MEEARPIKEKVKKVAGDAMEGVIQGAKEIEMQAEELTKKAAQGIIE